MIVSSLEGPVELWHNVSPGVDHWLDIKLVGTKCNRDAIGARIRIGNQWNEMTSAVSYASSSLVPVHFGLGNKTSVEVIEVFWPDGTKQVLRDVKADRILQVTEAK